MNSSSSSSSSTNGSSSVGQSIETDDLFYKNDSSLLKPKIPSTVPTKIINKNKSQMFSEISQNSSFTVPSEMDEDIEVYIEYESETYPLDEVTDY